MQSKLSENLSEISASQIFLDHMLKRMTQKTEVSSEDLNKYTNNELVDYYEKLFNITYSFVDNEIKHLPDDVKLSNAVISSKEKGEGLEEKLYSFCIPHLTKNFNPNHSFMEYNNPNFFKNDNQKMGIKVHVAIDPKNFRELPILAGALAKYTDLHSEDMTFKIQTEPKTFEEWSDYAKYNEKDLNGNDTNSKAGEHITIYFRESNLAKKIIDTLMKERIKVAKSFYGYKISDPYHNIFRRSNNLREISLLQGYFGITLKPYEIDYDGRSPFRRNVRSEYRGLEKYFPSMIPFIKSWYDKSRDILPTHTYV